MIRHVLLASTLLLALGAHGQALEKVLVPLAPDRVMGGFGSEWVTDLAVTNMSGTSILVTRDVPEPCPGLCVPLPLPAGATTFIRNPSIRSSAVRGMILGVERGRVADLAMTLRARDVSRQHETWGSAVPVVSADELYDRRFGMVDIPLGENFRAMLRVYDIDPTTAPRVRIRIFAIDPERYPVLDQDADTLLREYEPAFALPEQGLQQLFPASAEIPLWLDSALAGATRIRVEIEPLDGAREYWGVVSITHNETQHVTVITPR